MGNRRSRRIVRMWGVLPGSIGCVRDRPSERWRTDANSPGGGMSGSEISQIAMGFFLGIVLLRPAHLLLHELGHATAILALTSAVPTIRIGHGTARELRGPGRMLVRFGGGGWLRADCGYESSGVGRGARAAIAAAGPVASLGA